MTRISSKHCTLWRKVGRALLTACLGVPLPLGALAEDRSQAISSVTTKLSKAHCRKVGDVLMCKGIAGIGVMVIEGDSRVAVSYGSSARHEPAATLFFGPLNNIADEIEWLV